MVIVYARAHILNLAPHDPQILKMAKVLGASTKKARDLYETGVIFQRGLGLVIPEMGPGPLLISVPRYENQRLHAP